MTCLCTTCVRMGPRPHDQLKAKDADMIKALLSHDVATKLLVKWVRFRCNFRGYMAQMQYVYYLCKSTKKLNFPWLWSAAIKYFQTLLHYVYLLVCVSIENIASTFWHLVKMGFQLIMPCMDTQFSLPTCTVWVSPENFMCSLHHTSVAFYSFFNTMHT